MCATTPSIVIVKKQRHHPQNEDQFLELEVSQLSRQTSPAIGGGVAARRFAAGTWKDYTPGATKHSNHHIFNDKMSNYS